MGPVGKALWYIESHFAGELSLEAIARASGVSRYHLSRAFGAATDYPIMGYARARRLTEAAKTLAAGAKDILSVALDAGYGSHEAFTRAFRDQFGLNPETVRARRNLENLALLEPIKMDESPYPHVEPARFETGRALLIAGLSSRYNSQTSARIPAQWQRFGGYIGQIPGAVEGASYGVRCNGDEAGNIDYVCGVEVSDFSAIPAELSCVRIAPQKYAVFVHREHISGIRRTWRTIWDSWLPTSGFEIADAPDFERYGETFDPDSGLGGLEIWAPLRL